MLFHPCLYLLISCCLLLVLPSGCADARVKVSVDVDSSNDHVGSTATPSPSSFPSFAWDSGMISKYSEYTPPSSSSSLSPLDWMSKFYSWSLDHDKTYVSNSPHEFFERFDLFKKTA